MTSYSISKLNILHKSEFSVLQNYGVVMCSFPISPTDVATLGRRSSHALYNYNDKNGSVHVSEPVIAGSILIHLYFLPLHQ